MNKRIWYGVVVLFALLLSSVVFVFGTQNSLQSDNFPLRQIWTANLNAPILNISVSTHNNIIVQTNSMLYALNARTGEILWKYDLAWQGSSKSPYFYNHIIYLVNHDSLLAISEQSGNLIWRQQLPRTGEWVTDASEKVVLVNQVGEYIVAFDANTGMPLWQQPADRGETQAYIDENVVYIPGYSIRAFDLHTGTALWGDENLRTLGYVAYKDGVLYSMTGAFDLRNRKEVWQSPESTTGIVRLSVIGDTVFVSDAADIYAKRIQDGAVQWWSSVQYPRIPVVLNGVVYVFNGNHRRITAINLATGTKVGNLTISNMNFFVTDSQLMAASSDNLYFSSRSEIFAFGE